MEGDQWPQVAFLGPQEVLAPPLSADIIGGGSVGGSVATLHPLVVEVLEEVVATNIPPSTSPNTWKAPSMHASFSRHRRAHDAARRRKVIVGLQTPSSFGNV